VAWLAHLRPARLGRAEGARSVRRPAPAAEVRALEPAGVLMARQLIPLAVLALIVVVVLVLVGVV
jgi:hypothetical protein